jgi:hypothetical protein
MRAFNQRQHELARSLAGTPRRQLIVEELLPILRDNRERGVKLSAAAALAAARRAVPDPSEAEADQAVAWIVAAMVSAQVRH